MLKILIAVDGSDLANRAIETVGEMVRSGLDVQACLICVSPNIFLEPAFSADYSYVAMQKVEEEQRRQQDLTLGKATDLARAQGLRLADPERANGVIADEIVRVAKERKVNQIAMGTRGMGALGSVFMGSVAQRVVHQSPVPVLLANCLNSGLAALPLTDDLANIGNFTLKVFSQNSAISLLLPVSCEKSLDGNPSTTKPRSLYLACSASSPSYWCVKPQKLAVLTTSKTLPLYWHSAWGFSSCKRKKLCCSKAGHACAGNVAAGLAAAGAAGLCAMAGTAKPNTTQLEKNTVFRASKPLKPKDEREFDIVKPPLASKKSTNEHAKRQIISSKIYNQAADVAPAKAYARGWTWPKARLRGHIPGIKSALTATPSREEYVCFTQNCSNS